MVMIRINAAPDRTFVGWETIPFCDRAPRVDPDIRWWNPQRRNRPEDLPCRDLEDLIPPVIPGDIHEPNEAPLSGARNRKCATSKPAVELPIVLRLAHLPPVLPVRRRLDKQRFQIKVGRTTPIRADYAMCRHKPLLLKMAAYPIVPHV
jgi:hypothetical protein